MGREMLLIAAVTAWTPLGLAGQAGHAHDGSPYAGYLDREIKALSPEELDELRTGAGMGMAIPAELNGYPGPRHVLELADSLELTADQRARIEEIRAAMAEEAVTLGSRVVAAERALDRLFAEGDAADAAVLAATAEAGRLRAVLRATHLVAHLRTRAVLSEHQVHAYRRLRGYGGGHGEG